MCNYLSSIKIRSVKVYFCIFAIFIISGATICMGGMIVGGPLNGTVLPDSKGGMIVAGPLTGTRFPGREGGMIVGGPYNGTLLPGSKGGMIVGGPLNGTRLPGSKGGMIVGGPLNGTLLAPKENVGLLLMMAVPPKEISPRSQPPEN